MAIRMRRGNLADFDPTKQLSGEFGVSIDNSAGNQKVFMAFGNGNVKELMTVEDAEAQIGELVDDAVDAAIGDIVDTVTEAAETATTAAQTATTQAGTATTKAGEAASSASSASTDATSAAGSAASADDSAEDSEAWAVGQRDGQDVPTTDETYHNNAKYWAEQASQAAGGGVTSFNGRSGSVSPQSGDYTAAMVGLGNVDNTSDLNKPISTATQTALNGKADTSSLTDGSVTKIGTGTVGSATQPVYIDGGVPTVGESYTKYNTFHAWERYSYSFSTAGWYELMRASYRGKGIFKIDFADNYNTSSIIMFVMGDYIKPDITFIQTNQKYNRVPEMRITRETTGDRSNFAIEFYNENTTATTVGVTVLYRMTTGSNDFTVQSQATASTYANVAQTITRKVGDSIITTGNIRQAITTGTPTNPATGLTLQDSQFEKSGNVVVFRVAYKCTSNVTLTGGFAVCTLPWTPAYTTRVTRIVGDTNDGHTQNMSYGTLKTDKKLYGGPNDSQSTTGNYIEYYGTYLTND